VECLVNERGWLECLPRPFVAEVVPCPLAQLVVDERDEQVERFAAVRVLGEYAGNLFRVGRQEELQIDQPVFPDLTPSSVEAMRAPGMTIPEEDRMMISAQSVKVAGARQEVGSRMEQLAGFRGFGAFKGGDDESLRKDDR